MSRWPQLQLEGVGLACHEPTSGFADPVLTVETLVRSAQRDGLHVYEGCEVLGISTANGRVTGVVTGDGEIATGVVVNACGPWSDRIGRMAGVDYPLEFSREHEAIFDAPGGLRGLPGHLGRAAARSTAGPTSAARSSSATAGRSRRSRSTPRPTTTAPTTRT